MKLIKCRKCGTTVATDNTVLESLIGQMNEFNEMARKCKPSDKASYLQQAAQLGKMINQIQHRETQLKDRNLEEFRHLILLKKYVIDNDLMSYEEIDELWDEAVIQAKEENKRNEKEILKLYGIGYNTMTNRTKRDNTAKGALKNVGK